MTFDARGMMAERLADIQEKRAARRSQATVCPTCAALVSAVARASVPKPKWWQWRRRIALRAIMQLLRSVEAAQALTMR